MRQALEERPAPTCWHGEKLSWINALFQLKGMPHQDCLGGIVGAGEWGYGGVESVFPWRRWRRKHGALSVQWHLIDRYVREVCWCPEPGEPYHRACQSKSVVASPYEVSPKCEATRFLSAPARQGRGKTWRLTKTTSASWPVLVK